METHGSILICDDDPVFCGVARRLLIADGWEVIGAVTVAVDAIDFARVAHPDVVLMDISLAGMSGIEAIPALQEAGCQVVICSAFGTSASTALRAGAAAVVDKAELPSLSEVLESLVNASGAPAPSPSI